MGTDDRADNRKTNAKRNAKNRKRKGLRWILLSVCALALSAGGGWAGYTTTMRTELLKEEAAAVEAMVHMEAVQLAEYSRRERRKESVVKSAGRDNSQNLSKKQKYFTIMDFLKLSGVI